MFFSRILWATLCLSCLYATAWAAPKLPPTEAKLQDTVDHWGLPFSDQYRLYRERFDGYAKAVGLTKPAFVLGSETALRKTFDNKYWFKGQWGNSIKLQAGRNEYEAFQLAILPAVGAELKDIKVVASSLKQINGKGVIPESAIQLWRIGFVKTAVPQYPVKHIGRWPDPLLKLNKPFSLNKLEAGLIWWEVKIPKGTPSGDYTGTVTVSSAGASTQKFTINLYVWSFTLPDRIPRPTVVWIKGKRGTLGYRKICELFLKHHIDPISVGGTTNLKTLDSDLEYCLDRGLMCFQTPSYNPKNPAAFQKYYEHIKQKGWLDKAMIYGLIDEPLTKQFNEKVVPRTSLIRKKFPGLKTFLASELHAGMKKGTDIWLTDLSTNFHSWLKKGRPGAQELWLYFCHLPIRVSFDRPLVEAPNMLIDNDAIEHRVLNWLASYYGAKGVFIWAGNNDWPRGSQKWSKDQETFQLKDKPTHYPYAGIHNGNGFLIYPGPMPSIRLKVLRDGIEDSWYISELNRYAEAGDKEAQNILKGIVPAVFVDTHYFNRDPEVLLDYRVKIGRYLDKSAGVK